MLVDNRGPPRLGSASPNALIRAEARRRPRRYRIRRRAGGGGAREKSDQKTAKITQERPERLFPENSPSVSASRSDIGRAVLVPQPLRRVPACAARRRAASRLGSVTPTRDELRKGAIAPWAKSSPLLHPDLTRSEIYSSRSTPGRTCRRRRRQHCCTAPATRAQFFLEEGRSYDTKNRSRVITNSRAASARPRAMGRESFQIFLRHSLRGCHGIAQARVAVRQIAEASGISNVVLRPAMVRDRPKAERTA